MHHQGRIVPQSELFDHVYESEQDAGSNALEVLVGRVRKKLGISFHSDTAGIRLYRRAVTRSENAASPFCGD